MELGVPEETRETPMELRSPKQTFTDLKKSLMEPGVPTDDPQL